MNEEFEKWKAKRCKEDSGFYSGQDYPLVEEAWKAACAVGLQRAENELEKLKVGSCSCATKTPKSKHHNSWCTYRRITETQDAIRREREGL